MHVHIKKLGLPGYIDSTRIVGMHAAIFNIITLMATVSMMGYQKSLGTLSYISVDDATHHLCTMGPGILMEKN